MKKELWYIIGSIIAIMIIVKACEKEPKVITKTKIEYITKVDSIKTVVIDTVAKTVYVEKIKTIQGKDSIIYVDKPSNTTIVAKEYSTTLESNQASADLKITTTGKLLNVTGTITYPEKTITNDITTIKAKSGLFLYGETSVQPTFERVAVGLDYQIRNTVIVGSSIDYNNMTKSLGINLKLGFKIF